MKYSVFFTSLFILLSACNDPGQPDKQNNANQPLADSLKQIDQLISKDSLNNELWMQKAILSAAMKDTANAIRYLHFSNRINPTPAAMLTLANLLAEQKNADAITVCENIKTLFPDKKHLADIYFIKGVYYARCGNSSKAMSLLDSCINTNFHYLEAYMEKAFLLFEQQKIQEALTIFATVVKMDPGYADGYYWMGKSLEKSGKKDSAIINYQQAIELDPALTEAATAIHRLNK